MAKKIKNVPKNIISNVSRSSNVATITTSEDHGFTANKKVYVNANDDTYDCSNVNIDSVPSPTTFTYANTGDDETIKAATGTVGIKRTHAGMELPPDSVLYEIENTEVEQWRNNSGVETDIDDGWLVFNDGNSDITDTEIAKFLLNAIEGVLLNGHEMQLLNPPDDVYFSMINTMRDVFNNDYENVLMPDSLKNARVIFFQGSGDVESNSNCQMSDGNLELSTTGDSTKDNCDSITGYAEDTTKAYNKGSFALNTNANYYKTSTGSIDMNYNITKTGDSYGIFKTVTSEDWSSNSGAKVWVNCTHSNTTRPTFVFYFYSGGAWRETAPIVLSNGVNELSFDISALSRSGVTKYGYYLTCNDAEDFHAYIDDVRLTSTTHNSSGNIESSTEDLPGDVASIFVLERVASLPESCSKTVKLSLDGTNWHTITDSDFEEWLDVSGWSEQTALNKLRIRVELATTDSVYTPQYDDILVAYKLDTGA